MATMPKTITKRDGKFVPFDQEKIRSAIERAARDVPEGSDKQMKDVDINFVTAKVVEQLNPRKHAVTVEYVQDLVESTLIEYGFASTAKAYIVYRADHARRRDVQGALMDIYQTLTFAPARDADMKREHANVNGDASMEYDQVGLVIADNGSKKLWYVDFMAEEEDVQALADVLHQEADIKAALSQGIVTFMGHGNPESKDYYGGNIRYVQLEKALRAKSNNYYVGTVDMAETGPDDVLRNIIEGGVVSYHVGDVTETVNYQPNTNKKAQLFVLMSIAGDHAHNDMADADDDESWYSMFNAAEIETKAYETNFATPCWTNKEEIQKNGYIPGLAERKEVRKRWMKHTEDAIKKLGTEEALSTPTTEPEE